METNLIIDDENELRILHNMLMEAKFSISPDDVRVSASPFSASLAWQTLEKLISKQTEKNPAKSQSWAIWLEKKKSWIWERSLSYLLKNPPYRWDEIDQGTKINYIKWALSPYQPTEEDIHEFIREYEFYYKEIKLGKEIWLRKLGATNQNMLEQLEHNLHVRFSNDYREFLLKYNGGTPIVHYCTFNVDELKEVIPLKAMYGIGLVERYNLEYRNSFRNDIPRGYFIIGETAEGGKLLLGKDQEKQGVYYWSHLYQDDPDSEKGLYKLADRFDSFMNMWKKLTKSLG
ncbi:SMI1/KNR4 family protein [Paenibacillus shenyangensis]|uniref:SMI1/KNR4 family protein n=1 Tax=Paenibacillus sp. A9 TaxID=1284352 RepID=UPI00037C28DD|nr:SMI1/KNR4 family protein [Paenibacillus sp. A9]